MTLNLSISIPNQDIFDFYLQKNHTRYGGGEVFKKFHIHIWDTAIYEVWDNERIFQNLYQRIRELVNDIDSANYYEDFSEITKDALEAEKFRVIEGANILCRMNYKNEEMLYHLQLLFDAVERYVNKRLRIMKTVELVEELTYRIIQLQVDIQTGNQEEIPQFRKEAKNIEIEIIFLKNFGANEKEIERLQSLYNGAEIEIEYLSSRI